MVDNFPALLKKSFVLIPLTACLTFGCFKKEGSSNTTSKKESRCSIPLQLGELIKKYDLGTPIYEKSYPDSNSMNYDMYGRGYDGTDYRLSNDLVAWCDNSGRATIEKGSPDESILVVVFRNKKISIQRQDILDQAKKNASSSDVARSAIVSSSEDQTNHKDIAYSQFRTIDELFRSWGAVAVPCSSATAEITFRNQKSCLKATGTVPAGKYFYNEDDGFLEKRDASAPPSSGITVDAPQYQGAENLPSPTQDNGTEDAGF